MTERPTRLRGRLLLIFHAHPPRCIFRVFSCFPPVIADAVRAHAFVACVCADRVLRFFCRVYNTLLRLKAVTDCIDFCRLQSIDISLISEIDKSIGLKPSLFVPASAASN